jgi:hypothetical protein
MSGLILTTYDIVTPESAEEGDTADCGWIDDEGVKHSVQSAIAMLKHCEPSATHFWRGTWYTVYDYHTDYATGAVESRSYHLKGFSEVEERAIFVGVTRRGAR